MLDLKTIWSKRLQGEPETHQPREPATSIPRSFMPSSRSDAEPLSPLRNPFPTETRGAERFVPRRSATVLVTDAGKKLNVRIINVSALGVAVEADFSQLQPKTIVMVGERRVRPGRKIARGAVFLFEKPLAAHLCGPDFIL